MMFNMDNNELKISRQGHEVYLELLVSLNCSKMFLLDISSLKQIPIDILQSQQSLNFEKPNEIE